MSAKRLKAPRKKKGLKGRKRERGKRRDHARDDRSDERLLARTVMRRGKAVSSAAERRKGTSL